MPGNARRAGIALLITLLLIASLGLSLPALRYTMSRWTGEEAFTEQVKGTLALAWLRLTRTPPRTDPYVPVAHAGVSPYGVNTFFEQEAEPEKVERGMALIADAGFHWIRQEFPWEDIEIAGKGDYVDPTWGGSTWAKYDRIVDLAERHGLEVIARLDNPPAWSRAVGNADGWTLAPPDDYEDYGDFVYAVVSRYRGRIRYYQIWNEPNIFPEWGDQPADPEGYVRLLQIAYRRAKEADPDAVIICAGLAQTTEETPPEFGPRNVSDLVYLERMYAAGVQGYFDVMGAMVYGLWTGPYDLRTSRDRTNFSRVALLREIMVRHGDGDKAIWATEIGWNATPDGFVGPLPYGRVTEAQRAEYAVQAYQRAAEEWPWMGVMNYWFLRRPSDSEKNQSWYYFRMLEDDFTPLPVYDAVKALANQPPTVYPGYHQEDHWALQYEGDWRSMADPDAVLGACIEGREGAQLRFAFQGTSLELVLRDGADAERLQVTIDGQERALGAATTLAGGETAVHVARNLRDARHKVVLEVVSADDARGDAGAIGLDGLIVRRERAVWPAVVGGAALLTLVVGLTQRRHRRGRKA
ncbi:MAG: cellulase family glycosylhydrolase [Anaerolineae bacterium]